MSATQYRKHFIPLESNPDVFTDLIHDLGVSPTLCFQDIWTLDEPGLLPHPALALILVFPTSETYEKQKAIEEDQREEYVASPGDEDMMWFKQTINNACGLYAILHAVCNGDARKHILTEAFLSNLIDTCRNLNTHERALMLEDSDELEKIYNKAANQGDSPVPTNAEDEVDFHYICFVKSHKDSCVYELDGDRKGPINKGVVLTAEDDVLSEAGLGIVREFMDREGDENLGFSLMVLTQI